MENKGNCLEIVKIRKDDYLTYMEGTVVMKEWFGLTGKIQFRIYFSLKNILEAYQSEESSN